MGVDRIRICTHSYSSSSSSPTIVALCRRSRFLASHELSSEKLAAGHARYMESLSIAESLRTSGDRGLFPFGTCNFSFIFSIAIEIFQIIVIFHRMNCFTNMNVFQWIKATFVLSKQKMNFLKRFFCFKNNYRTTDEVLHLKEFNRYFRLWLSKIPIPSFHSLSNQFAITSVRGEIDFFITKFFDTYVYLTQKLSNNDRVLFFYPMNFPSEYFIGISCDVL